MTDPICDAKSLQNTLEAVVLLDARTGPTAREDYEKSHLAGARFVDLETELAAKGEDAAEGGRHPLPSAEAFAVTLGRLGITPESDVVVYDTADGANAAARAWWMLRALGHERVRVLEGGLSRAIAAGLPTTSERTRFESTPAYPQQGYRFATIGLEEVARWAEDPAKVVLDVRSRPRYRGEAEPIDPLAGHIPGARNFFYLDHLRADGTFRAPGEIAAQLSDVIGERAAPEVAVHCGSGVTACFTILAMERAGLGTPALYVGSWGEWCRRGRAIATGGEDA